MNYWIVGATWGNDNLADRFFLRGSWEMGYDKLEKPNYAKVIRVRH